MNAKEKLLAKFRQKSPLTKAALPQGKEAQAALKELLAEGAVLKIGTRFFLETTAPTVEREKARIDARLRAGVRLFKESTLQLIQRVKLPTTRAALDALVDARILLRLEIEKDRKAGPLYLHSAHAAGAAAPASGPAVFETETEETPAPAPAPARIPDPDPAPAAAAAAPDSAAAPPDFTLRIRRAYTALAERGGSDSVFISELAEEAGIPVRDLHLWIQENIIGKGLGALNEGDWSYASGEQRAAAIMLRERPRLYVRFHS